MQHIFRYYQIVDANDTNDTVDKASDATTIVEATNNARTRQNQRGRVLKRKRRIEKTIILGTRVLEKYGELVPNPKGPKFRRACDWVLGNITKSIGNNRCEVKFHNRVIRECSSQALRVKESTLGTPIKETVPQASKESIDEEESNYDPGNDDLNDDSNKFLFPMDSAGID